MTTGAPCPTFDGDGLCLAKTWCGAASGGIPAVVALLCEYDPADVLGEDPDKLRVRKAYVKDVFDPQALVRAGFCAGADLSGADLRWASLAGADLTRADLRRVHLSGANLTRADLLGANLTGAFLYQANLCHADLRGADLSGADLYGADLRGADLTGADLAEADLRRADLCGWERGPHGFARRVNGGGR